MFRKINIFLLIFIFTNIIPFKAILQAQEVDSPSTSEKVYSLNDLYKIALKESEKINISKENLYIAERTKERALSVLFPRFHPLATIPTIVKKKFHLKPRFNRNGRQPGV